MPQVTIEQAMQVAFGHHEAGRLAEAEKIYRQVLSEHPNHAGAIHYMGVIAHQVGRNDAAVEIIGRAIQINPNYAEAYSNLGIALRKLGKLDDAIAACQRAIQLKPDYAEAYINLGAAFRDLGRLDEAIAAYREAIRLKPADANAYYNLGVVLCLAGHFDEAVARCRRTIELNPGHGHANSTLGNALREKGLFDEAIDACRKAIDLAPDFADAHLNLAMALLLLGDFSLGWPQYEWRWQSSNSPSPAPNFRQPQWDGADLNGRTILLHAEQGFGDTLQFIRYVPNIVARGGRVILACQPELRRLLEKFPGVSQVFVTGQQLPSFDVHCPLLSLPLAFDTTPASIPNSIPYLSTDPQLAGAWKSILADSSQGRIKVGLAWAGKSKHTNDKRRSMELCTLAPLGSVKGVQFYSLQTGAAASQTKAPDAGLEVIDVCEKLTDFAETAAMIANLDLVITVDTAVAHLAGAMGKPVWVLLPFVPDWRWMLHREDSPWYPTMRLFRQKTVGNWDEVIARVTTSLAAFSGGGDDSIR